MSVTSVLRKIPWSSMKNLIFSVFHNVKGQIPIYTDIDASKTVQACNRVLVSIMANIDEKKKGGGEALVPLIDLDLVVFVHYFHMEITDSKEKAFCFIAWVLDQENKDIMYYNTHLMIRLFLDFERNIQQSLLQKGSHFEFLYGITEQAIFETKKELSAILDAFFQCSINDLHQTTNLSRFISSGCIVRYGDDIEKKLIIGKIKVNLDSLVRRIVGGIILQLKGYNGNGETILPVVESTETIFCSFSKQENDVQLIILFSSTKAEVYKWAELISEQVLEFSNRFLKTHTEVNSEMKKVFKKIIG